MTDWIQAISALVILGLTAVLAWATSTYAQDTKRMANLMQRQYEASMYERSEEAAGRLSQGLLSLQRMMGRRGSNALVELPDYFDRWQMIYLSHAPMIRDRELSDRLETFHIIFLTVSQERPIASPYGHVPGTQQATRLRNAIHAIRLDLDAHRSRNSLPSRQLPHQSRMFDWLDAPAGANLDDFGP